MSKNLHSQLPLEEDVINRNRVITAHYANLYIQNPVLFKWCGMAAFASFHIGERLKLWDWTKTKITPFPTKDSFSFEDDINIIRLLNNKIFSEMGKMHFAFNQMDYSNFNQLLIEEKKHDIILKNFEILNYARTELLSQENNQSINNLIWQANIGLLWHEQSQVVQPFFNQLGSVFSNIMSLYASFDYNTNHKKTNWKNRSRFLFYMLFKGFFVLKDSSSFPDVTNLRHRWHWITNDLIKKWQKEENTNTNLIKNINLLANQKI